MFTVLIDTSAFEAQGLSFNTTVFNSLELLCKQNRIRIYKSFIIINECKAHLEASVTRSINRLKKAYNEFDHNTRGNFGELAKTLSQLKSAKESILEERTKTIENFFFNPDFIELDINRANVRDVFAAYFNQSPPFGDGNKKQEFPDAFLLQAFIAVNENKLAQTCLVSQDGDWQNFAALHPGTRYFDSLGKFIDFINNDYSDLFMQQVRSAFTTKLAEIKTDIQDKFLDHDDFEFGVDWIDPYAELDAKSVRVEIGEANLLSLEDESADWELKLTVIYQVKVWDVDGDSWIRDYDTNDIIYRRRNIFIIEVSKTIDFELDCVFEPESIAASLEINDLVLPDDLFNIDLSSDEAKIVRAEYDDGHDDHEDY